MKKVLFSILGVLDTASNAQSWKIVMLSGGTSGSGSKELVMPVNHNQKISNDKEHFSLCSKSLKVKQYWMISCAA